MANIKSAKKRAIQSEVRRKHNNSLKSNYRTAIKRVLSAVVRKDKEGSRVAMAVAVKTLDKAVNKDLLHINTVARYKSKLNRKVKTLLDS